jgi:hypothetical protein
VISQERDRKLESARKLRQEKRVAAKEFASFILRNYTETISTKDRALKRCKASVVASEVAMRSDPIKRAAPFICDFDIMR